jgi:PTHB1 N-terminus
MMALHHLAGACRLPGGGHNLVVATHTCNILVYSGNRVVWVAKGPTVPVAIRVAQIGPLEAALVIMDDEGLLTVCYLGTAPPTSVLGLAEGRETDWEQIQARRKELAKIIKDKSGDAPQAATAAHSANRSHLSIRSQVRNLLGMCACKHAGGDMSTKFRVSCRQGTSIKSAEHRQRFV